MIVPIDNTQTYLIRQEVLRKGKPIETCHFDGDTEKNTIHFGFFHHGHIVGVVSVFKSNSTLFNEKLQFQIRGMAVLNEFQCSGIGNELMLHAENYCRQHKSVVIWFNAREKAVRFYEKNDYQILGDAFEIPDVGTHFVMFKKL